MQASVQVGPSLFRMLGEKVYSSPPVVILVRELLQNAVDAHKRAGTDPNIRITISVAENGSATVSCDDRGIGMTAEQIVNDFLCAGSHSYEKDHRSQTGGFAIAKIAILACESFSVHTLDNRLNSNLEVNAAEYREGTEVICHIAENKADHSDLNRAVRYVAMSDVDVHMTAVWRDEIQYLGRLGLRSNAMSSVSLYDDDRGGVEHQSATSKIVSSFPKLGELEPPLGRGWVRTNGLVQYESAVSYSLKVNLMVDIDTSGIDPQSQEYPFTVSRESLSGGLGDAVSKWFRNKATDAVTTANTVKRQERHTQRMDIFLPGYEIGRRDAMLDKLASNEANQDFGFDALVEALEAIMKRATSEKSIDGLFAAFEYARKDQDDKARAIISKIKGIKLFIDAYYDQRYGKEYEVHGKLLTTWAKILDTMLVDWESAGIGFTTSGSAARMVRSHGTYYLINPDEIPAGLDHNSLLFYLWHLACHEMAHKTESVHNEHFTSIESYLAAKTADRVLGLMKDGKLRGLLMSISRFYSED